MSRSYNKVAVTGICISNHKANSKYYKRKRRYHRLLLKRDLNDEISNIEDNMTDCSNIYSTIYNRKFRKTHRNEWDEPTDGRYKWFKKRKGYIIGNDWHPWNEDKTIFKEYLYKKYSRK